MKSLESLNAGKPYAEQIKPFNFLLTSNVSPFGHPLGANPDKFHLISPYDSDSRKWLEKEWIVLTLRIGLEPALLESCLWSMERAGVARRASFGKKSRRLLAQY